MSATDLKAARLRLGLTQQQLADMLQCSRNTVSNWERGRITRKNRSIVREFARLTELDDDAVIRRYLVAQAA